MSKYYPCDEFGCCPFNANEGYDCYNFCGLGADESETNNEEED